MLGIRDAQPNKEHSVWPSECHGLNQFHQEIQRSDPQTWTIASFQRGGNFWNEPQKISLPVKGEQRSFQKKKNRHNDTEGSLQLKAAFLKNDFPPWSFGDCGVIAGLPWSELPFFVKISWDWYSGGVVGDCYHTSSWGGFQCVSTGSAGVSL